MSWFNSAAAQPFTETLFDAMASFTDALRPTATPSAARTDLSETAIAGEVLIPRASAGRTRAALALSVYLDPRGAVARSFRDAVRAVRVAQPAARVLRIVGASPRCGASTCASNFAIALAEAGERVLLIDANVRRPIQHEFFQMSNDRGLRAALGSSPSAAVFVIRDSELVSGLDLLPCESTEQATSRDPAVDASALAAMVSHLSATYHRIVIDEGAHSAAGPRLTTSCIIQIGVDTARREKAHSRLTLRQANGQ